MIRVLFAERAWLDAGWAEHVSIEIDERGCIVSVTTGIDSPPAAAEQVRGPLIPGMVNCHSHAFQRAMAGLTERRGSGDDSFWSWRDIMYRFVAGLEPEQVAAIAAQVYLEMLLGGYTRVAEFHYLHHDRDGRPYPDPAEMAHAVICAAGETGIGLTLLPVLYQYGDFGAVPPGAQQRRFIHSNETYPRLLQKLAGRYREAPELTLGVGLHSLRAVNRDGLTAALQARAELFPGAPVHIHIAEQRREVDTCLRHFGKRPVAWLLDTCDVDARWCLVHATHVDPRECRRLADCGAVVGLCPTTEANLGDGIFPATAYCRAGGRFAIGSDSNISVDPTAELRLLEYAQRLQQQQRNLLTGSGSGSVGAYLYREALHGGARAAGVATGRIAPGSRADLIVLDSNSPILYGKRGDTLLDAWIFAGQRPLVREVIVGGQWRVVAGRHAEQERIERNFKLAMDKLVERL